MFDQGPNIGFTMVVAEGLHIIAFVGSRGEQVVFEPCFYIVVQRTSVTYNVSTSTSAVILSNHMVVRLLSVVREG